MANRLQLYKYKGNQCSGCGKSVKEMVDRYGTFKRMFAFHHIDPSNKDDEYSKLIEKSISSEQINEIDKCALLCTECHNIIHAQEITGNVNISIQVNGRKVTQAFEGWFKYDQLENSITFISNQRFQLLPCKVKVGEHTEKLLCISEIEYSENLLTWLRNINTHKLIEIRSCSDGKLLMKIEHVSDNTVKVKQEINFPVTALDISVEEGDASFLWVRNGIGLTREGEVITNGIMKYTCNLHV